MKRALEPAEKFFLAALGCVTLLAVLCSVLMQTK